jgi:aspartyl protease family protein
MNDNVEIVKSLLILSILVSSFVISRRYRLIPTLKYTLYWILIFIAGLLAYSSKGTFSTYKEKIMAELVPGYVVEKNNELIIKRANDGHFYLYANLNGVAVKFMIDTGATNVVISAMDAKRVGLDPKALKYDLIAQTANGIVRVARAKVKELKVGNIIFKDFMVNVSTVETGVPLMGMAFLSRMEYYSFQGDTLILKY